MHYWGKNAICILWKSPLYIGFLRNWFCIAQRWDKPVSAGSDILRCKPKFGISSTYFHIITKMVLKTEFMCIFAPIMHFSIYDGSEYVKQFLLESTFGKKILHIWCHTFLWSICQRQSFKSWDAQWKNLKRTHCYFTRLNPKRISPFYFCLPTLLGNRNSLKPKAKRIFEIQQGILKGRTNRARPSRPIWKIVKMVLFNPCM